MSYDDRLSNYNDVASRMREFFDKHPHGVLRPWNPDEPFKLVAVGERTFIAYTAVALREPNDANPGIGTAWEPFPGGTPYTKDSELMNAETSAWGRAILAVGAADTKKGIASAEEVRNRQQQDPEQTRRNMLASAFTAIAEAAERDQFDRIDAKVDQTAEAGVFSRDDVTHLRRFSTLRQDALFPQAQEPPQAEPAVAEAFDQHKRGVHREGAEQ